MVVTLRFDPNEWRPLPGRRRLFRVFCPEKRADVTSCLTSFRLRIIISDDCSDDGGRDDFPSSSIHQVLKTTLRR